MDTLRYILALIVQIHGCASYVIDYLDQSLDIDDWCIVYQNEIDISHISLVTNLTYSATPMTFTTPDSFNCIVEHNTMVLFKHIEPETIETVLDQLTQYQLAHNYLVILTKDEMTKYALLGYKRALSIRTSILVFEGNQMEDYIMHEITGTAIKLNHRLALLGKPSQVELRNTVSKTRRKRNLNGITFKANFNHLPPFCIVDGEQVNGTFFDLLKTMENVLNFTLTLQKPSKGNESWGKM